MKFFLCVMGMVLFIEGLPWFAFPDHVRKTMARISNEPGTVLRGIGFLMMVAGLVFVYIGKH